MEQSLNSLVEDTFVITAAQQEETGQHMGTVVSVGVISLRFSVSD